MMSLYSPPDSPGSPHEAHADADKVRQQTGPEHELQGAIPGPGAG